MDATAFLRKGGVSVVAKQGHEIISQLYTLSFCYIIIHVDLYQQQHQHHRDNQLIRLQAIKANRDHRQRDSGTVNHDGFTLPLTLQKLNLTSFTSTKTYRPQ